MRAAARDRLRAGDDEGVLRPPAGEAVEDGHVVRRVAGSAPGRAYRCPGCDQELDGGTPHVVAWPEGRSETTGGTGTPPAGAPAAAAA